MTNALTLGVVGHVDHGKTALVRALTGIETDRLKEERERGLSIVLGFAFLETERGVVDLIDVPGHEDFIRAMIAGATALDGIVMCIAANEGVMPQTVEHMQIARLLGVDKGLIVITKADLVGGEELASLKEQLARFVRGTFLEGAPVIEVSAASGQGVDAVREAVTRLAAAPIEREQHGRFFLPLDRVFTIRGFGLVATGTLRGGELRVGDAVEIVPGGQSATVRGLQNHNRPVDAAAPGERVAVNLRHVTRDEIERGDVLAAPGSVVPAQRLDAEVRLLEDAGSALKNGALVRFLTGTTEATARLRLLDRQALAPGESGLAQLKLDRAVATRPTERLLLRSYSPMRTIGGGQILAIGTKRHKRFDAGVNARLESEASGDVERIVAQRLESAAGEGLSLRALTKELGAGSEALGEVVTRLGATRLTEDLVVTSRAYETLLIEAMAVLERFHRRHPLKRGLDIASLANELPSKASLEVVQHAVQALAAEGKVERSQDLLSLAAYDPFARLTQRERKLVGDIEQAFLAGGLEAPPPDAVVGSAKAAQVIYALLLETGRLVRLKTYDRNAEIVMHARTVEDAWQAIAGQFPYPRPFAVKDVRDLLRSTRKHVVPLLEHFDATGRTVRSGDVRRVREG